LLLDWFFEEEEPEPLPDCLFEGSLLDFEEEEPEPEFEFEPDCLFEESLLDLEEELPDCSEDEFFDLSFLLELEFDILFLI